MTAGPVEDAVLWRAVAASLADAVLPALPPGHAADTAVQLTGLARYAAARPEADPAGRARRLRAALGAGPGPDATDGDPAEEDLGAALRQASAALVDAVTRPERAVPAVRAVLLDQLDEDIRVAAPLLETFSGHPATDVAPVPRGVPEAELDRLARWFADACGGPVEVTQATVVSGGHSRRMLRVELRGPAGPAGYMVRIEQGGTFGTDGTLEAGAMRALADAGLPVPPVRWIEGPGVLGRPFFVMDLVPGSSAVDDQVLDAFVAALHGVHRNDPAVVSAALGPVPGPDDAVAAQIDRWEAVYRGSVPEPVPLLDEAAAWLRAHLRPTGPTVVVHGDPGPGNFLSQDGRIVALTDWEFVHHGDAAEDWAYLAIIRGRKLAPPEQWYARIERITGVRLAPADWHAWEAFNQFKGACANLTALRLFRDGVAATPNLLAIGTAVHYRFLRRLADLVAQPPG
ncbi:phosphotransferase family protein [Trujillonella humicola]|uniref:phosphotransferase family protein n=1 Tax=Trujillonella humicola TaxID=3383699 RepID=UPI0039066D53